MNTNKFEETKKELPMIKLNLNELYWLSDQCKDLMDKIELLKRFLDYNGSLKLEQSIEEICCCKSYLEDNWKNEIDLQEVYNFIEEAQSLEIKEWVNQIEKKENIKVYEIAREEVKRSLNNIKLDLNLKAKFDKEIGSK